MNGFWYIKRDSNVFTHSVSNFRKIFVTEEDLYIFFAHFHMHISSFTFIRQDWNAVVYYLIV